MHSVISLFVLYDHVTNHVTKYSFLISRVGQHNVMKFASQLFDQAHTEETTKVFWTHLGSIP